MSGRLDVYTLTLAAAGEAAGGSDVLGGERLPKQRPHLSERKKDEEEDCLKSTDKGEEHPESRVTASAAPKVSEDISAKDAEISRLIEERRNKPKEEKHKLKDVSKCRWTLKKFWRTLKEYEMSLE